MERQSFYVGSLLHDIGKFIERAKSQERIEKAKKWMDDGLADASYAHRRYGADFVWEFRDQLNFVGDLPGVRNCVLYHHKGRDKDKRDYDYLNNNVYLKMIRLADSWASAERQTDSTLKPQDYFKSKLVNIFSLIHGNKGVRYLDLNKLVLNHLIPDQIETVNPVTANNQYEDLVNEFIVEFKKVKNQVQLFYVLEKYLSFIPAQSPIEINGKEILYRSDISLFDHLRVTAAIALCLYDDFKEGQITENEIFSYKEGKNHPENTLDKKSIALLVQVDFSGIQSFIFDIKSKGAAKSLKGRSFYLQLLSDVIARYILDELELPISSLLYNGGGNFYILAPKSKEVKLQELRKKITRVLYDCHRTNIYAALGWVEVKGKDFEDFSGKWQEVSEATSKMKSRRYSEIGYERVFEPFEASQGDDTEGFEGFTNKLKEARFVTISKPVPAGSKQGQYPNSQSGNGHESLWQKTFRQFGYEVSLGKKGEKTDSHSGLLLNDTDFLPDHSGFKFSVVNLPENSEFDSITNLSNGDKKLAYLKMDVDNLGKIFKEGLEKNDRTISRIASLSRMLRLFFEGYLNKLIRKYADKIYPVYSGGDDTFLIGAWDAVFDLAEEINRDFKKFVAQNPKITASAGLNVFHPHFPVIRASNIAEEALDKGKSYRNEGESEPSKNKVAIMGQVFNWKEFEYIKDFQGRLVELIENGGESRALLSKVYQSTIGFNKLVEGSNKTGRLNVQKVWRFNYYLRNMKTENKEAKENLIKTYSSIILDNLMYYDKDGNKKERISNPMLIPVATRWAELKTKGKGDNDE